MGSIEIVCMRCALRECIGGKPRRENAKASVEHLLLDLDMFESSPSFPMRRLGRQRCWCLGLVTICLLLAQPGDLRFIHIQSKDLIHRHLPKLFPLTK